MGARQRDWARRTRLKLRRLLGLVCKHCGNKDYRKLEFDVIKLCGNDHHRRMDWSWRMSFYRRMFAEGNLQLLCSKCHGKKTYEENYE